MPHPCVVTTRDGPDLDGVASAIAYAELLCALGNPSTAVIIGQPDAEARFVLARLGLSPQADVPAVFAGVVLVDISALDGLPEFVVPGEVIEVIDHRSHDEPSHIFENAHIVVDAVGAAATMVFERFRRAGISPTRESAWLLQGAIQSNTQRLRGTTTTARDVEAVAALQALAPISQASIEGQFYARRAEILDDVEAAVRRESKTFRHGGGSFAVSQLECLGALELLPEVEGLTVGERGMVNLVDPFLPASCLWVPDPELRSWVSSSTGLTFAGTVARPGTMLLRKQLVAMLIRAGGTR